MKELICITCPKGCHLTADEENGYAVTGNDRPRLPVKTDRPLPKGKMFQCMELINGITAESPVCVGQVLAANILDTDVNIVAAKSM